MEILKLNKDEYGGRQFTARYTTHGYYDIRRTQSGFEISYERFECEKEKSFDDHMFSEWSEAPVAYGAFESGDLIGYIEGSPESWNNRYRVSNICIFDSVHRHMGVGTALMNTILEEAKRYGARMIVLETQTCNEKAIAFYRKNGFEMIGFDLFCYTNTDPQRHEIRLEMGKQL